MTEWISETKKARVKDFVVEVVLNHNSHISSWYCGYVSVTSQNEKAFAYLKKKLKLKSYQFSPKIPKRYHYNYENLDIECHGGVTYCEKYSLGTKGEYFKIGWDYNHAWDTNAEHSFEEVYLDCCNVVEQLINLSQNSL